jgi:hypothetical protein
VHEDPQGRAVRALVNNAGIGVNAPVEVFAIDEWRRLFEVNFFGHIAVIQTLLPALIRNKGRVVNISSVGGKIAMATYGPYAGTKFALEAVSDALRREVEPLGVKVIVVEPAAVTTEMLGRVAITGERITIGMTTEQRGRYSALMHSIISQAEAAIPKGVPAEEAGRVIADAITARGLVLATPLVAKPHYCLCSRFCPTGCSTASLPPLCVPTFPRRANHDLCGSRGRAERYGDRKRFSWPSSVMRSRLVGKPGCSKAVKWSPLSSSLSPLRRAFGKRLLQRRTP